MLVDSYWICASDNAVSLLIDNVRSLQWLDGLKIENILLNILSSLLELIIPR